MKTRIDEVFKRYDVAPVVKKKVKKKPNEFQENIVVSFFFYQDVILCSLFYFVLPVVSIVSGKHATELPVKASMNLSRCS